MVFPFFYVKNRPTPRDLHCRETQSERPAGNMQLRELNVALLYSWAYYMVLKWIEKAYNRPPTH